MGFDFPRIMLLPIMLLAISLPLSHASECTGSSSILVPAVMGEGSDMVNISVRLIGGSGLSFVSTYPQTGTSTQQSLSDAVTYGLWKANATECDAIIAIDTGSASFVEGPSAGAASAIATYAAALGLAPRNDAVMTGSVDSVGNIGPVGGLYEKSLAAFASGAEYFVTPKETFFDLLMLRSVRQNFGLKVLEAQTIDEAAGFMLYNRTLPEPSFSREAEPVPEAPAYNDSGMPGFGSIASGMMYAESEALESLPSSDNDSRAMREFFESELSRQENISGRGYRFTAANEAFLDYIELRTIGAVFSGSPDLKAARESAGGCIASLPKMQKTDSNFEYLVGSDLRKSWALRQINNTDIGAPEILEEKYIAYNELMYADAWCEVSRLLGAQAGESGTSIDESAWKEVAEQEISQAEGLQDLDADLQAHLDSALLSMDAGRYGAALYDSVYVVQMYQADSELAGMDEQEVRVRVESMLTERRSSLWGAVYQSHAAWMASPNVSSYDEAYRTLLYAQGLDRATVQMRNLAMSSAESAQPQSPFPVLTDFQKALAVASMFIIIILLLSYVATKKAYEKGLSDGSRRGAQGPRPVPGATKKQGRAAIPP